MQKNVSISDRYIIGTTSLRDFVRLVVVTLFQYIIYFGFHNVWFEPQTYDFNTVEKWIFRVLMLIVMICHSLLMLQLFRFFFLTDEFNYKNLQSEHTEFFEDFRDVLIKHNKNIPLRLLTELGGLIPKELATEEFKQLIQNKHKKTKPRDDSTHGT